MEAIGSFSHFPFSIQLDLCHTLWMLNTSLKDPAHLHKLEEDNNSQQAQQTLHAMPCHGRVSCESVLTISFNCFSSLSARWPCPWPDCTVAAILRFDEVNV